MRWVRWAKKSANVVRSPPARRGSPSSRRCCRRSSWRSSLRSGGTRPTRPARFQRRRRLLHCIRMSARHARFPLRQSRACSRRRPHRHQGPRRLWTTTPSSRHTPSTSTALASALSARASGPTPLSCPAAGLCATAADGTRSPARASRAKRAREGVRSRVWRCTRASCAVCWYRRGTRGYREGVGSRGGGRADQYG